MCSRVFSDGITNGELPIAYSVENALTTQGSLCETARFALCLLRDHSCSQKCVSPLPRLTVLLHVYQAHNRSAATREAGDAPRPGFNASISSVTAAPEGAGQRTRPPVAIFRFGTRSFVFRFFLHSTSTNAVSKFVDSAAIGVEDIQRKMEQLNDEMAKEIARVQKGNGGRSSRRESFNPVQRTHEVRDFMKSSRLNYVDLVLMLSLALARGKG